MYQNMLSPTQPIPNLVIRARSFSRTASLLIIGLGLFVLTGWFLHIDVLTSIIPGMATMKVNTAVLFILCGASLWSYIHFQNQRLAQGMAALVMLGSLLTLGEYILNLDLGIDQLLYAYPSSITQQSTYPGRPSSGTAINFFLTGLALFYFYQSARNWIRDSALVIVCIFSVTALTGYIFDISSLYHIDMFSSMAVHTSLGFILISMGILFASPSHGMAGLVLADTAGGRILRRMLPVSIILPILLGWMDHEGYYAGFYEAEFRMPLLVTMLIVAQIVIVWSGAMELNKIDHANKRIFRNLQASESRFRNTIESMTEGFEIIGFDWRHIYVNDAAVKNARLSRDELIGRTMQECFPGIEKTSTFKKIQSVMDDRQAQKFVTEYTFPDESRRWFDIRVSPSSEGIFIQSTDITQHHLADQAIREREEKLQKIFEVLPVGITVLDENRKVILTNPAVNKVLQMSEEGLRTGAYVNRKYLRADETPMPPEEFPSMRAVEENKEIMDVEIGVVKEDGKTIWTNVSATPVNFSDWKVLTLTTDITLSKQADQRFQLAVEAAPNAIVIVDEDGKIVLVNTQTENYFGYQRDELIGKPVEMLIPGKFADDHFQYRAEFLAYPKARAMGMGRELFALRKDGSEFPVEIGLAPVDTHEGTLVMATVVDITTRRKAEQALKDTYQRQERILNSMFAFVGVLSLDGLLLDANRAPLEATGLSAEDVFGKPFASIPAFSGSEFAQKIIHDSIQSAASGEVTRVDLPMLLPNGYEIIVDSNFAPLRDVAGNIVQVIISGVDVTDRKKAENIIRYNEHILRLFVVHAPASIAMFDTEMRYIVTSRRYALDYGLDDRELTGRSHYDVLPEIPERWREIHRRCLMGFSDSHDEDPFVRSDGRTDWIKWEIHPWYEPSGEVGGIILFSEVITARKEAEEELRRSERNARALLNAIPDLMFRIDRNGVFLDYKAEKDDLYAPPDIVGKNYHDLMPQDFVNLLDSKIRSTLDSREMQTFLYQLPIPGRGVREYDARMFPSGKEEVTAIVRDISDINEAKGKVEETQRFLEDVINNTPAVIYVMDTDGRILLFNRRYEQLFGMTLDEGRGKIREDFMPAELAAEHRSKDLLVIDERSAKMFEETNQEPDGIHYYITTKFPLFDNNGDVYAVCGISVDITERIKAEKELQKLNEELDQKVVQRTAELAEANVQLQQMAIQDELTKLYNRRGFLLLAEEQILLAKRSGQNILVFYADLDELKQINDVKGHKAGDNAIIQTANAINETFRTSDIKARLGGDEFIILAIEAHKNDSQKLIKRLQKRLEKEGLSISVGAVSFDPQENIPMERLILRADQAMYAEKLKKPGSRSMD